MPPRPLHAWLPGPPQVMLQREASPEEAPEAPQEASDWLIRIQHVKAKFDWW